MTYLRRLWVKAMTVSVAVKCGDRPCQEVLIWPNKQLISVWSGADDEPEADFAEVGKEVDISVRGRLHLASRSFPLRLLFQASVTQTVSKGDVCNKQSLFAGALRMSASVQQL